MKKSKWVVAYYRVSSDEQREKQTIENQRAEGARYAKEHGIKFDRIYEDDGVTGTIEFEKRPSGGQLMHDVRMGLIEEIYVLKFDRLGRNARHLLNVRHRLKRLGVEVKFMLEGIPEGDAGELYMQIMAGIAEWDRKNLLGNMRRGKRTKASDRKYVGGRVFFGYRKEGKGKLAEPVRHETNADIVLQMFERAKSDESFQQIAEWLTAQGIPTSVQNCSSTWQATDVLRIIRNPVYYTGKALWGRTFVTHVEDDDGNRTRCVEKVKNEDEICEIDYPPIVPAELWHDANAAVDRRASECVAHTKTPNLLRGLITCSLCGCKFTGRGSGRYYVCIGRHSWKRIGWKKPCTAKLVHQKELVDTVWGLCDMYITNPEKAVEDLAQQMEREAADPQHRTPERLKQEKTNLEKNAEALRRIRRSWQDQEYPSRKEYDEDLTLRLKRHQAIEAEIKRLEQMSVGKANRQKARSSAKSFLEKLRDRAGKGFNMREVRMIIDALVKSIIVHADGDCEIKLRFAYDVSDALRRAGARKFPATPTPAFEPLTRGQVQAGVDALDVALLPTIARSN